MRIVYRCARLAVVVAALLAVTAGPVLAEPAALRILDIKPAGDDVPPGRQIVLQFDRVAVFSRGELAPDGPLPRRFFLDFAKTVAADTVPRSTPAATSRRHAWPLGWRRSTSTTSTRAR